MQVSLVRAVSVLILSLHLLQVAAFPIRPRDVSIVGPEGNVSMLVRWRDTVGTATQVWAHGPASPNEIFQTDRLGPMSNVYRSTLGTEASTPCEPDREGKCEVAIDGFGLVGEVHYDFESTLENIKGRSTQVMIACRCLSKECGDAVLIRPINVLTKAEDGTTIEADRKTCIYEAVGEDFSDCHTELLRVTYRDRNQRPNYTYGKGAFNYSVADPNYGDNWNATGQRGWERDCLDTELSALPTFSFSKLQSDQLNFNVHSTGPAEPHCTPQAEGVRYFREEDGSGTECSSLYEYAAAAAAHRATQQDEIAIGNTQASYVYPKPELVSDTELALSCSGAALGLLFVWTMFRRQMFKRNATTWYTAWVGTVQVLSFILEALPLHTALGSEISARNWVSQFASVDGTLALAKGHLTAQGTAQGSILILTAVLGEVRYRNTRITLILALVIFFDVTVVTLVVLTALRKLRVRHLQKRGLLPKRTSKDPEFSAKLLSLQLMPGIRIPGMRRRGQKITDGVEVPDDSLDLDACNTTATPCTSSGYGKRVGLEEIDNSLQRPASEMAAVGGHASFITGTTNGESMDKEQSQGDQANEANVQRDTSDGKQDPMVTCDISDMGKD